MRGAEIRGERLAEKLDTFAHRVVHSRQSPSRYYSPKIERGFNFPGKLRHASALYLKQR
jgi:hypothetical protein